MRTLTATAILLDVRDLHDRDRVVSMLTAEHGKKRGVARGARRKYSRFSGQLQPLAKVRVTWFEKEASELVRISGVELERPAHRLQADLEGFLVGSLLAEHMLEFAQENEASDHLFRLLDATLEALLAGVDRAVAARYFEAWVLRLAGIFPAPGECPLCGRPFAPGQAAVLPAGGEALLCGDCARGAGGGAAGALAVRPQVLDLLRRIGRESLPRVAASPPDRRVLAEVEALCGRIRRPFLGRELRSYEVMRRMRVEV